ncbi:MAG: DnaJ domain-containing protein [Synergistaceae bacterium]|jgi:hypothetical protein|nr:DnaJ domain-containing protein [Synergistaceae bacterium]
MMRDAGFETLGLPSDATWDDVKRAFRRLARTYHPDIAGPSGARKFAEITEAYMTLKETASPGLGKIPTHRAPNVNADRKTGKRESIFKRFWRRFFSRKRKHKAKEEHSKSGGFPPAAAHLIGGVITRAESEMYGVLSRREEFASRVKSDAIIRRLKSRRPAVTLLALRRLSKLDVNDDIAAAVMEHFRRNMPCGEVLEVILDVFSNSPRRDDIVRALLLHAQKFPEQEAVMFMGRLKRWGAKPEFMKPFLSHKSSAVIAGALSGWPGSFSGEKSELAVLLNRDDEAILIPLLRLLKKEPLPRRLGGRLMSLMKEHPSAAVRVWASAIVRDQKLS